MNVKKWMKVPRALADHAINKLECRWQRKNLHERKRTILWLFALFAALDLLCITLALRGGGSEPLQPIESLNIRSSCQMP